MTRRLLLREGERPTEEIEGTFIIDSILCKKKVHSCLSSGPLQAEKMFSPSAVCISPAVLCVPSPVAPQMLPPWLSWGLAVGTRLFRAFWLEHLSVCASCSWHVN